MLNHVTIMGRLGADPELRYTNGKLPVARFSLAVDRDYKDKASGERATDWINVVAWRGTAEYAAKYFRKGRMAVVEGRLQTGSYTDQAGNKRNYTEVVAENIYFADSKTSDGNYERQPNSAPPPKTEYQPLGDDEGTLPF